MKKNKILDTVSSSCEAGIWWFSEPKQTTEDRILEKLEKIEKQLKIINKKLKK